MRRRGYVPLESANKRMRHLAVTFSEEESLTPRAGCVSVRPRTAWLVEGQRGLTGSVSETKTVSYDQWGGLDKPVHKSSLDGAQNAPPTTAHKALSFTDEEEMHKMSITSKGGSRG